jgi:Iap family predicted aminopeptidase
MQLFHCVGKPARPSQWVFELYCNGVTMCKAGLDSITIQIEICIEIIEICIEIIISNCDEPRNWNAIVIQL